MCPWEAHATLGCSHFDQEALILIYLAVCVGHADAQAPRRLGPKRAGKIRALFNLDKKDDLRKYVIRRKIEPKKEGKKATFKAPKIQRLVTPRKLQRKRHEFVLRPVFR